MSAQYSVLWYERKASSETFRIIESYVKCGIKVYYITGLTKQWCDSLEPEKVEKLEQWTNYSLISLNYEIEIDKEYGDSFLIEDGNLNGKLFHELESIEQFNIGQYKMEHADKDNNLVVMAGAGTGKTKTMIDRILYLVFMGYVKLDEIVMITFTNEAAMQMREKLLKRLENYFQVVDVKYKEKFLMLIDHATGMKIQTIHSFSKYFLNLYGDKLGLSTNFSIRNLDYQKRKIIEQLFNDYHFSNMELYRQIRYVPQYKIIDAFMSLNRYCLARGIDCGADIDVDWGEDEELYKPLFSYLMNGLNSEINVYKSEHDVMELSDLVIKLTKVSEMTEFPNLIQISYLFVDEFQDTDDIQIQFIVWLMEKFHAKVCVVGDKKQSIYRFRGAAPTAFDLLTKMIQKRFPNEKIEEHYLQMNYRSSKTLIHSFNQFFQKISTESLGFEFASKDKLIATIGDEYQPCIHTFPSKYPESITDTRIERIQELVEETNLRNIALDKNETVAVLTRTNRELEQLVMKLEEKGIVCKTEISGNYYRGVAVREFYIMLMALLYPKVPAYQYAFLNSSYGEGNVNDEILNNMNPEKANFVQGIVGKYASSNKLDEYRKMISEVNFLKILHMMVEDFKPYINYGIRRGRNYNAKDKHNHCAKIQTMVRNYKKNLDYLFRILEENFSHQFATLFQVEEFLRVNIETNDKENEQFIFNTGNEYDLVCMTVHKAKGLEFDHVILPETKHSFLRNGNDVRVLLHLSEDGKIEIGYWMDVDDTIVTNSHYAAYRSEEEREVIAEEVRLLYVAVTRAKKNLHICKDALVDNIGKCRNWMELIEKGGLCK